MAEDGKVVNVIEAFHELYPDANDLKWSDFAKVLGMRMVSYHVTEPHGFVINRLTLVDVRKNHAWTFDWRQQ